MQSIQTGHFFSLDAVKPLDRLLNYRKFCLEVTQKFFEGKVTSRTHSPVDGSLLVPWHNIESFEYKRCSASGSLFLAKLPEEKSWADLLAEVSQYRASPDGFHADMKASRQENVFQPKLHWIQNTMRLKGLKRPKVLEVASGPSQFKSMLEKDGMFSEVASVSEFDLLSNQPRYQGVDIVVLLEALDRSYDPARLLKTVMEILSPGGLLFVTSLVSSGFDIQVLGPKNVYLYPPDRANCFSLQDLKKIVEMSGLESIEVSTPGLLDVEIVRGHLAQNPTLVLSDFEKSILGGDAETLTAFQSFLQQSNRSSFARIAAKKDH